MFNPTLHTFHLSQGNLRLSVRGDVMPSLYRGGKGQELGGSATG